MPLGLTPNYLWGSFPSKTAFNLFANNVKIVMLEKNKSQKIGMDYYRNIKLVNDKPQMLSNFFYLSYQNGDADFVSFNGNLFYILNEYPGHFVKKEDTYYFNYSGKEVKCFKMIKGTSFFYEAACQSV